MIRITGGQLKGLGLLLPPPQLTRPTSNRVRQAIFNVLEHGFPGFNIQGAQVLDLFAGSGAMGIEAISHGAAHVTFIEKDLKVLKVLEKNCQKSNSGKAFTIINEDSFNYKPAQKFDLIFLDPPYEKYEYDQLLEKIGNYISSQGIIVLETDKNARFEVPLSLQALKHKIYGQTKICFMSLSGIGLTPWPLGEHFSSI